MPVERAFPRTVAGQVLRLPGNLLRQYRKQADPLFFRQSSLFVEFKFGMIGAKETVLHRVPEDLSQCGGIGTEDRRDAGGEVLLGEIETLQHPGPGPVIVGPVIKDDIDHPEAEGGGGTDGLDLGDSEKVGGERVDDLVFDIPRGSPRPVGEDDNLELADVGDGIDRCIEH